MKQLREMIEGKFPVDTIMQLISSMMEDTFVRGQASGIRIEKTKNMYRNHVRSNRSKEMEDVYEDAVQEVLKAMVEEMPCHKGITQFGKCPKRHITAFVVDKYKNTFTERVNSSQKKILDKLTEKES